MKIGYLGTGAWGSCLAAILVQNGHKVKAWGKESDLIAELKKTRKHPFLKNFTIPKELDYVDSIEEVT